MGSRSHVPERTCIACRRRAPQRALVRLAAKLVGWKVDIRGRAEAQAAAAGALFGDAGEAAAEEAGGEVLVANAPPARSGMEAVGVTDLEAPGAEEPPAGDAPDAGSPRPAETDRPTVAPPPS